MRQPTRERLIPVRDRPRPDFSVLNSVLSRWDFGKHPPSSRQWRSLFTRACRWLNPVQKPVYQAPPAPGW
ncbi:hypothetical protein KCP75_16975 [Salmonella enterica subsp. enterica]|nr:hypothetical protein KCP75_16975 [Salmonella enterica subsp. enterica]